MTTYNALVTTVTVSNAGAGTGLPGGATQTRTTTRNSQGQVVTVADTQSNTVTYTYDHFGNLKTTNAGGVTTTLSYDLRGRKTQMVDKDMGTWTYAYNALGELIRQVDAKSQTTTMTYDVLGRMTTRTEPDLISTWTYDSCTKGVGKLCAVSSDNGYARTHGYDSLGRPSTLSVTVDTSYSVTTSYDSAGRADTLTYPTGFAVKNNYNSYGYLASVQRADAGGSTVFWQANSHNAAGQATGETLGNGLTATRTYDELFRLTAVSATGTGGTPHSQSFAYDPIGNITQRVDVTQSVTENFAYDTLNRLNFVSGPAISTRTFDFDAIGNITYKSDVGGYTYPGTGSARPHAVSSVSGSGNPNTVTASYAYDANGSLTAASGTLYPTTGSVAFSRTLTYTSFNMPLALSHTQGSATYSYTYTYNAEHERVKLVTVRPSDTLTSIYLHPAGKGALLYEKETRASDGLVEHKHYVNGGSGLVGVYLSRSDASTDMRYYHKDHLGSIAVITNPSGAVIERLAYEAFGERRYASGAPEDRASPLVGVTTDRGFTGHEHLDEMMLIHMNGRIYDPVLARFMTSDPFVQTASNLQSYNRYSYVLNNPLMYTDPTGYFSFKKLFAAAFAPILDKDFRQVIVTAAVAYYTGQFTGSAFWGGFAGGFVGSGGNLEAGLRGGISAGLFWGAGELAGAASFAQNSVERALLHAGAGCVSASLSGGDCGRGALAAGITKYVGANTDFNTGVAGAVKWAVLGGTASSITGGSFANGAITGSFQYLFNQMAGGRAAAAARGCLLCPGGRTSDSGFGTGSPELDDALGVGSKGRALILNEAEDAAPKPPTGSKPIDQTDWSGDHRDIKNGVGAGPRDRVHIAPSGGVWVQNPDGSWRDTGSNAGDHTGSDKPSGRTGRDREKPWRR